MRIRFKHPTSLRLDFAAGDEISVRTMTPALESLLVNTRLDGQKVAEVVEAQQKPKAGAGEDETADLDRSTLETATTGRGAGRGRAATVPQ